MEYLIGDFSRISRLSIKTLRYYHECGLLSPVNIDKDTGYRYYDEKCLERVKIIEELKELEFPLKDIRDILDGCMEDSDITGYVIKKEKEIREKIDRYDRIHKKLDAFIDRARYEVDIKVADRNGEIVIRDIPDILIASIRFTGKYQDFTGIFQKIFKHCGRYSAGAPLSLYYDNEYKEDADIEVCVPVKKVVSAEGINCRLLKGGKALVLIHRGPYDTVGESYKVLIDHISTNGMNAVSPAREVYLKGPGMIIPRSPKKYITELQMIVG